MCHMDEFGNWKGVDHFGNPHDLPNGDGVDTCLECGDSLGENEVGHCADCEWQLDGRESFDDEPDVDEAQEWADFDPDC